MRYSDSNIRGQESPANMPRLSAMQLSSKENSWTHSQGYQTWPVLENRPYRLSLFHPKVLVGIDCNRHPFSVQHCQPVHTADGGHTLQGLLDGIVWSSKPQMCYIVIYLDSLNISNQTIVPPYNQNICCNRQLRGIFTGPFMPCIICRQQVPLKDGKWKDGETEKIIGQLRQLPVEHIIKTGSLGTKCGNSPKMLPSM